MPTTSVPALVIRRTYAASPARVYAAWTEPDLVKQFLGPKDVVVTHAAMDVRVGGAYHIAMLHADGDVYTARGTYRIVEPARRLAMTWTWDEEPPETTHETMLTLEFLPHGEGGTEFTLTHEQLRSDESRTNHERGWTSILDKLAEVR